MAGNISTVNVDIRVRMGISLPARVVPGELTKRVRFLERVRFSITCVGVDKKGAFFNNLRTLAHDLLCFAAHISLPLLLYIYTSSTVVFPVNVVPFLVPGMI